MNIGRAAHIGVLDDTIRKLNDGRGIFALEVRCADLSLDLSPPDIIDGWPVRVDGMTIALAMVCRACALGDGTGAWLNSLGPKDPAWTLRAPEGSIRFPLEVTAGVDWADPLADRLAMTAILIARPWVTGLAQASR